MVTEPSIVMYYNGAARHTHEVCKFSKDKLGKDCRTEWGEVSMRSGL